MAYVKQQWVDGYDGKTPVTAARLGHIEDGVEAAATTADSAAAGVTSLSNTVQGQQATLTAHGSRLALLPGRMEAQRHSHSQSIGGGFFYSWQFTFTKTYPSVPVVVATPVCDGQFKGSATVYDLTATGCKVRIDNIGSASGTVSPAIIVVG